MEPDRNEDSCEVLPACVVEYIAQVTRQMRYRRRARAEVGAELTAHFEDALKDCAESEQREARARELIEQFGDAKLLAVLCRRAKKRCRPLWQKVFVRTAQAFGVLLLYAATCSLPLFLGRPTIRVNYVEWLNEHWRPEGQTVANAAVYYEQAAELYVEPPQKLRQKLETTSPQLIDYNDVELRWLATWLSQNAPALAKLRQGTDTVHYWPIYHTGESDLRDPNLLGDVMDTLTSYRQLAFALNHEVAYRVYQGDWQGGFNGCLAIRRFGRHLQGRGLLVEQLVGIALEDLAYKRIAHLLRDAPAVSAETLTRMHDELLALCDEHRHVISLDGEKAFWYDAIQRTFTDDGKGGGRALRQGIVYAAGDWQDNLLGVFVFDYPDRRETVAMIERFFADAQKSMTISPQRADHAVDLNGQHEALGNLLLGLLPSAYAGAGQQGWALKTHEAASIVTVAIFAYEVDKSHYPATLEELVEAGYLSSLPQDPFGPGLLTYKVTPEGFLLYSWGENLTDDDGMQDVDRRGKHQRWSQTGDWVFWPLMKPQ